MSNSISICNSQINVNDDLYSLNDLHKASGGLDKDRPVFFLKNEKIQDLIKELRCENSNIIIQDKDSIIKIVRGKGKQQGTYACKELVIAYAAWISPKFHLQVIRVFLAQQAPISNIISKEQQGEIATLIAEKFPDGGSRPGAWSRFNNHFRIASYKDLPASKYDAAIAYIEQMKAPEKLAASNITEGLMPAQSTLSELRVWSLQNLKREDADYVLKQCEKLLMSTTRVWTAFNEILIHLQIAENYAKRFQHLI